MPTLREYELAFESDPAAMEPFLALRKVYRERRKFDKLVTLYETRAQVLDEDAKAADLFYLAAEVRVDHLSDPEGAEVDLRHALSRYAGHVKAAERLKLMFRDQGRTRDYMTMMEVEASGVVQSGDAQRKARLAQEMAQLYANLLAPLERAVQGPQKGQPLSEDDIATIESARKISRALGDWPSVVRLYELELGAVSDTKRRVELMVAYGKVLADRMGRLEEAVARFGEAARLAPREEKALELLAAVYARPEWPGPDGKERAATQYHQIARRRHEAGDIEGALALLRKAIAAQPGHEASTALIERILYEAGRLKELDRYYRERVAEAGTSEEKMDYLWKRAQLAERDLQDPSAALLVYEELVSVEPPGGPAAQHLAGLYAGRQNYAKLADLRERQLEVLSDPALRLPILHELAVLYRDRLGDPEQSAVYLHAILQIDPGNEEAQQAYGDHFRRKSDWASLLDLLEFSLDHAQKSGAAVERLVQRIEEIAVLAERHLSDTGRALAAWRRLEEVAPEHERAREAQKRILLKDKNWGGLAEVLEREAVFVTEPVKRQEVQRRLAKLYLEKLGDRARSVAWFQRSLAGDPTDAASFRALVDIHESQGDWAALAGVLRAQLEAVPKAERIALLRRLGTLYLDQLDAPLEAAWAARALLELQPGDQESFERLERILERTGDVPGLVQVLEAHLEHAEEPLRGDLVRRAARLRRASLQDPEGAAALWERLVATHPGEPEALEGLAEAYQVLDRPDALARVYDLQLESFLNDPARRTETLRALGTLAVGRLHDPARAIAAWEALLHELPGDGEALLALTELYRDTGKWRALDKILSERIAQASDPSTAVPLALERAALAEEQLRSPGQAVEVLEQLVTELDPRNAEAFARLRRIALGEKDWPRLVSVCERQMFLEESAEARLALAIEIGTLQRERLGDPAGAVVAFERALAMAPEHIEVLRALAHLYAITHEPEKLVATHQKLLGLSQDPAERRQLMTAIGAVCEESLGDPRRAFEWARRVRAEFTDEAALDRLRALAALHGLWEELLRVHEAERARATDPGAQLYLSRQMAELCEVRLLDPARAFGVLRDALASDPAGSQILPDLERLAETSASWSALLDVYARVARARATPEERLELLRRRARVREERLGDPSGAMEEWLRAFAIEPDSEEVRLQIERLAELSGRWEDALKIEAQVFARATDIDEKVTIAKRAAALVEGRVRDPVRAFRGYLNAFRLAPEDPDVVAHLWRLARSIGSYGADGAGELARPAPVRAVVEIGRSSQRPDATVMLALDDRAREATQAIDLDELEELEDIEELAETPAPVALATETRPAPPPAQKKAGPPPMPGRPGQAFASAWEEFAHAYTLLPANDNPTRRRYLLRQAEIWEKGADDLARALSVLERAFRLDPFDADVRRELTRLAEAHAEWDRVCEIHLAAITPGVSADDAVRLHHAVAAFRERLGQHDLAEERYRAIIELHPDDGIAMDRLEAFCRAGARHGELASLLERRTTSGGSGLSDGERRQKSLELAGLYEHHLDRPYEAIDTLERYLGEVEAEGEGESRGQVDDPRAGLSAELCGALESLGRLYGRVELWAKAAEVLRRARELLPEGARRREVGLEIARIFAQELAQPGQAAQAYQAVLADAPDDREALAALDRLFESLGRFEALAALLERRIAAATDAEERLLLTKRRARILEERLDNPDAAAANLRALGAEALEDDEVAGALLRNLRRAGLFHEAATLMNQRIERLQALGAHAERIAGLWIELGRMRLEDVDDSEGACAAFERALVLHETPEALRLLGQQRLRRNDFAAFARDRRREAKLLAGKPEAVAALIEAGEVFRDQLEDPASARSCFEEALRERPDDARALRALAALLVGEGNRQEARDLLERQLEVVTEPNARAVLLTDLARVTWDDAADLARVVPWLDEAIGLAPDYVPALVTLADIYYREQAWEQAERRLAQALRRSRGQPAETAALVYRLGETYEKLGKLDEGYRHLQDADRKSPEQLLIKVALGSNRHQARRWREVVAQLESLGSHPEVGRYPEETARGLALAGDALLKLKQPERARSLFEAALRFVPQQRMALLAMADLCIAAGDWIAGVDHLRKAADATPERADKVALLQRVGDLHREHGRAEDARAHYEAAVQFLDEPASAHVPLLERTLALQTEAGALAEATETSTRLIALMADPAERAKKRREAAATLLSHGQLSRAAELLTQTLEDDGRDEKALAMLVDVHERLGKSEASLFVLERVLPGLPAPGSKAGARAQRAALWEKLGELRTKTDLEAAAAALERAVQIDPERVSARVLLSELYGEGGGPAPTSALDNHRALALADLTRDDSIRAVARAYAKEGNIDAARCAYELLDVLGLSKKSDRAFLSKNPVVALRPDEPYPQVLAESLRAECLSHPESRGLTEVFATLWESGLTFEGQTLESLHAKSEDRISPMTESDLARILTEVSKALDNKRPGFFLGWDPAVRGIQLALSHPPGIVIAAALSESASAPELRFRLGRALELARPEYILAAAVPPRAFARLFGNVLKAFHPRHARRRAGADSAAGESARLKKELPYKISKRLAELFAELGNTPFSSARWREVVDEIANRAGLVMCGDLATAARVVLADSLAMPVAEVDAAMLRDHATQPGPLRELLRFALSDAYFKLREGMGLGARARAA